jgi:hypothetical protein
MKWLGSEYCGLGEFSAVVAAQPISSRPRSVLRDTSAETVAGIASGCRLLRWPRDTQDIEAVDRLSTLVCPYQT